MDTGELTQVRRELDDFVAEVFASLPRTDQRGKGGLYLQGLVLDGRRKSMQPMSQRLGVDHQQLQQFVSSSPWPVEPVRQVLVDKASELIGPEAWVVDDTGFTKDGPASPGVARQYSGTLGKVGNCQIAVSVHAATDAASCPLNWRLFIPEAWDDTCAETNEAAERAAAWRERSRIPETVRHRPKWQLAMEMIDELAVWGHTPPLLAGDAGYGESAGFRGGLTERAIPYVVAVKSSTTVHPADAVPVLKEYTGRGPKPRTPRYQDPPISVKQLITDLHPEAFTDITWRQGTKAGPGNPQAFMTSRFTATRVRAANRHIPRAADGTLPAEWLITEWPVDQPEPTDYWLSTLPQDTPLAELVRMAKIRWRIEHDYRELKHGLGLDHFEGRSWTGWHHHATLVTAAHLFITTQRLAADPKAHGAI